MPGSDVSSNATTRVASNTGTSEKGRMVSMNRITNQLRGLSLKKRLEMNKHRQDDDDDDNLDDLKEIVRTDVEETNNRRDDADSVERDSVESRDDAEDPSTDTSVSSNVKKVDSKRRSTPTKPSIPTKLPKSARQILEDESEEEEEDETLTLLLQHKFDSSSESSSGEEESEADDDDDDDADSQAPQQKGQKMGNLAKYEESEMEQSEEEEDMETSETPASESEEQDVETEDDESSSYESERRAVRSSSRRRQPSSKSPARSSHRRGVSHERQRHRGKQSRSMSRTIGRSRSGGGRTNRTPTRRGGRRTSRRHDDDDDDESSVISTSSASSADSIISAAKKSYRFNKELLFSSSGSDLSDFDSMDSASVITDDSNSLLSYDTNSIVSDEDSDTCYFTDYTDGDYTDDYSAPGDSSDDDEEDESSESRANVQIIVHDPKALHQKLPHKNSARNRRREEREVAPPKPKSKKEELSAKVSAKLAKVPPAASTQKGDDYTLPECESEDPDIFIVRSDCEVQTDDDDDDDDDDGGFPMFLYRRNGRADGALGALALGTANGPPNTVSAVHSTQSSIMMSSATFSDGSESGVPMETMEVVRRAEGSNPFQDKKGMLSKEDGAASDGSADVDDDYREIERILNNLDSVPAKKEMPTVQPCSVDNSSHGKAMDSVDTARGQDADIDEDVDVELNPHDDNSANSVTLVYSSNSLEDADRGRLSTHVAKVDIVPFVHGSFAAAAPMLMRNLKWMRILRKLMPHAHAFAVQQLQHSVNNKSTSIMKWAENNPVVAAFGMLAHDFGAVEPIKQPEPTVTTPTGKSISQRFLSRYSDADKSISSAPADRREQLSKLRIRNIQPPILEWDVFLHPELVTKVDKAIKKTKSTRKRKKRVEAHLELDRQIAKLIQHMVLAHGSTLQLAAEALGIFRNFTFASLVEPVSNHLSFLKGVGLKLTQNGTFPSTPDGGHLDDGAVDTTSGGAKGMFVDRWLSVFASALSLGSTKESATSDIGATSIDDEILLVDALSESGIRSRSGMFGALFPFGDGVSTNHGFHDTIIDTAAAIEKFLGCPLRVVLNLKSGHVPASVWACLVDGLRARGIHVEAVSGFEGDKLRQIAAQTIAPVKQYFFFHSAGDLQSACHAGKVQKGDNVFFNGASLFFPKTTDPVACGSGSSCSDSRISRESPFQPYAYTRRHMNKLYNHTVCKATIETYKKKFDLSIGVYVQEYAISPEAIEKLARFINGNSALYNLGLAWGGVNGRAASGVKGDGFWKQRFMGTPWDRDLMPTYNMEPQSYLDCDYWQKMLFSGRCGQLGTVNSDWTPINHACSDSMVLDMGKCSGEDCSDQYSRRSF